MAFTRRNLLLCGVAAVSLRCERKRSAEDSAPKPAKRKPLGPTTKSAEEIAALREGGAILAGIFVALEKAVAVGVSTEDLAELVRDESRRNRVRLSFEGYLGFPSCLCASINNEVAHGVPSPRRKLKEGDLLKIDCGIVHRDLYVDAARTFPVGASSPEARSLVEATRAALAAGISAARLGNRVGDISQAIEAVVRWNGFTPIRDLVGHGVGHALHELPQIPNFGTAGTGLPLERGWVLAIEPIVNQGSHKVLVGEDTWTVMTEDGMLSAQFEETIVVTEDEPEVLTRAQK